MVKVSYPNVRERKEFKHSNERNKYAKELFKKWGGVTTGYNPRTKKFYAHVIKWQESYQVQQIKSKKRRSRSLRM